jgi:hypothetical protein
MAELDGLLKMIPIGEIAKKLGVSEDVAEDAVQRVLPTIVAGMSANSRDKGGAASLQKAFGKHESKPVPTKLADVDTDDGEKIVNNIFGKNRDAVAKEVAKSSPKADESIIQKILPIVAPIVISWLASRFFAPKTTTSTVPTKAGSAKSAGGGIGDVLGGLLGGGGKGGVDLGGLLGGLLGGGKK